MLRQIPIGLVILILLSNGLQIKAQEGDWPEGEWRVNNQCQAPEDINLVDGWNSVKPGEDTMCAHGTEFQFWVRPSNDDLLVYLQGGGACLLV